VLLRGERLPQFKQKTIDKREIRLSTWPVKSGALADFASLQHHSGMVIDMDIRHSRVVDEGLKNSPPSQIRTKMDD
jgi:hypothetical protein